MSTKDISPMNNESQLCPICHQPLSIRLARGRKSGKPFVMLICNIDGRHFRGFINDRPYVQQVTDNLESNREPRPGD
jgi:hypothetical protein